jgi:MYXO-CTERM domain-containing protein
LRWRSTPVPFAIARSGAATLAPSERGLEFAAIRRAFLTWEGVAGSAMRFDYRGRMPDEEIPNRADGINGVRFFQSNLPEDVADSIGVTLVIYDDSSGRIFDADMLFNERDYRYSLSGDSSSIDLESVVLHEAGHVVGLDHTCGAQGEVDPSCYDASLSADPARRQRIFGAVMYPLRAIGDPPLRNLTSDDAEGIAALYPASPSLPAPRPSAVVPGTGGGRVDLTIRGQDFLDGAAMRLYLDDSGPVEGQVISVVPDRIAASVDLSGRTPGCYDVVVQNPSGKQGVIFGAFGTPGVKCRSLELMRSGCSCAASGGGGEGGILAALAIGILAWRRRRTG